MIKSHEKDLTLIKSCYDELKTSTDKVKSYQFDSSINSTNDSASIDRQAEDLKRLNELIAQLSDRWNTATSLYITRYINK